MIGLLWIVCQRRLPKTKDICDAYRTETNQSLSDQTILRKLNTWAKSKGFKIKSDWGPMADGKRYKCLHGGVVLLPKEKDEEVVEGGVEQRKTAYSKS